LSWKRGRLGMHERGVVTRVITPGVVEVSMQASEACEKCCACHRSADGAVSIEAIDAAGAKDGDIVDIEISTGGVVAASFVVYLLPVLFLIAGYLFGSTLNGLFPIRISDEAGGIVGALVFLAASFGVVRGYDRKVRRDGKFRARVTRVLSGG
jgi:sigma-E factor negative regulatory protein RseC